MVKLLLGRGAIDVNLRKCLGDTAILTACRAGNIGAVYLLSEFQDIEIDTPNNLGEKILIISNFRYHGS
jgi:ankyrin repeat protein